MKALAQVVATLSHVPGVVAAMIVGATDGLIVETSPVAGSAGATDPRKHTAALAAYLYSKVIRASDAARLGTPAFMRLEAERGHIFVVGAGDVVLVTIVTTDANLGRVRLEMMTAARDNS
ncbi:MAG TPA: roadblock/LC7 domain-containing protein [Gemmatimonadaceae bacterium]|jgi:predicted regulator of Ras-like GTPase activity (Roadblock/LC7/MglB family)|nr:roadblock/LC7 domain-containing protein [Gemmatimonadaceae bacterium]